MRAGRRGAGRPGKEAFGHRGRGGGRVYTRSEEYSICFRSAVLRRTQTRQNQAVRTIAPGHVSHQEKITLEIKNLQQCLGQNYFSRGPYAFLPGLHYDSIYSKVSSFHAGNGEPRTNTPPPPPSFSLLHVLPPHSFRDPSRTPIRDRVCPRYA